MAYMDPAQLPLMKSRCLKTLLLVGATFAVICTLWATAPPRAEAYTGPYCYNIFLYYGNSCSSSYVSYVRRAIGRSYSSHTEVAVYAGGYAQGLCFSYGCTADTNYVAGGPGGGSIYALGGPNSYGGDWYFGYLYQ